MAYNLIDMAWVFRVGAQAVVAVGTARMYTWLPQGVAILAKTGNQIKVTHFPGEERLREVAVYTQGAAQTGIVSGTLFAVTAVVFAGLLIGLFGLNDAIVTGGAKDYLRTTCGGIVFSYSNAVLTDVFTAQGDSRTPFKVNFVGLAVNIMLDLLLILDFGPVPRMEAAGVAITMVTA